MQTMTAGYRSFALIFDLHWEKLVYVAAIAGGLVLGAALGTTLTGAG